MESEKTYNAGPLTLDSLLEEKSYETARIFDGAEESDFSEKIKEYHDAVEIEIYEIETDEAFEVDLVADGAHVHFEKRHTNIIMC